MPCLPPDVRRRTGSCQAAARTRTNPSTDLRGILWTSRPLRGNHRAIEGDKPHAVGLLLPMPARVSLCFATVLQIKAPRGEC